MEDRPARSRATEVAQERMECPLLRVPLVVPGSEPDDVTPIYEQTREVWGTVPRFIQLLAHVPAAAQAWVLIDREVRVKRLARDPDHVRLQELAIIKTSMINGCNN
jgi:hypothetical protein